jgi:CHAD domain-containing protein
MSKRSTRTVTASAAVAAGGALAAGKVVHDLVADRAERKRARRFRLEPGETARDGIARVARGQLDLAIELLDARHGDRSEAVHEARKALKRLRTVLRLCRDWLGEERFRQENTILRDAGRSLSGARDAQVLVETLDALRESLGQELPDGTWSAFRERLVADSDAHEAGNGSAEESRNAALALAGVRDRVEIWPLPEDGGPECLAEGFERVYAKARRARRRAARRPTSVRLHELRKRTKDVWYAGQLLDPLAQKWVRKLRRRSHRLSDALGDDHDLVVLVDRAEQLGDTFGPGELELLRALTERRRRALEREALERAGRLYRRKPHKLVRGLTPA